MPALLERNTEPINLHVTLVNNTIFSSLISIVLSFLSGTNVVHIHPKYTSSTSILYDEMNHVLIFHNIFIIKQLSRWSDNVKNLQKMATHARQSNTESNHVIYSVADRANSTIWLTFKQEITKINYDIIFGQKWSVNKTRGLHEKLLRPKFHVSV